MTTLSSFAPVAGDGSPTEQQQDAFLRSLRDDSQSIVSRIDDHFGNRKRPEPSVADHQEVCKDIQQVAGDESVEVETMADSKPTGIISAIVPVPQHGDWTPNGGKSTPPLLCNNLPLKAARAAVIALNRYSIDSGKSSRSAWAIVIRKKKSGMFGVLKMPVEYPFLMRHAEDEHPEIEFERRNVTTAFQKIGELNGEIARVARQPKIWHVLVVQTQPTPAE